MGASLLALAKSIYYSVILVVPYYCGILMTKGI